MEANKNPNLVLGTAGHIDHGKSALVMSLTGVDPDRLEEEKKRGITIELGWAQLELPDGRRMTVVDVPGHEKFVKQMIVGAAGVDVALLVIAADDGVMPQTTEHVAVLETLGIESCVVALTKIDLVDEDWLALVQEDIRKFLANTPYANARIVPCSNRTGEGVEDVRAAIAEACDEAPAPHRSRAFRQPVHKVFTVKGAGTIVTGVVWSGVAEPDEVLEILPSGKRCRIRGVQVHGRKVKQAPGGNCVAVNVADVKNGDIESGDFLATPGSVRMTDRFDCYFSYHDTAGTGKPLASGTVMHIAHGAKEVLGRVLFADGLGQLAPGQSSYAQIRLEEELPVSCYDRFIARSYSPVRVAGGGQVLLSRPKRRTNLGEEAAVLQALHEGHPQKAVELALSLQNEPKSTEEMASLFGMDLESMTAYLETAIANGAALLLGSSKLYLCPQLQEQMLAAMEQTLKDFHKEQPAEPGMKKETLRQACFPRLDADCFDLLVNLGVSMGKLSVNKGLVGHESAQAGAEQAEQEALAALQSYYRKANMTPPEIREVAAEIGITLPLARRAVAILVEQGALYKVTPEQYYSSESIARCKQAVAELCGRAEGAALGELRDAIGVGRRAALAILEAFDKEEFTVHEGEKRYLKA